MDFDKDAAFFDNERRQKRAEIIGSQIRTYIDHTGMSAMEFGCGTGLIGLQLIDLFSSITFIDSSQGMIEQVNCKIAHLPNAVTICIDLLNEQLENSKFDIIFTSMVLHHINNTKKILEVLHNLLNANGRLIIVDLDKEDGQFHMEEPEFNGHNGFDQKEMATMLNCAGFKEIDIRTFYNSTKRVHGQQIPYSLFIVKAVRHENE